MANMTQKLWSSLRFPFAMLAILWGVHLINWLLQGQLNVFGVLPRDVVGLRGVLFSPLLHSSWTHLASNSVPFFVLLCIMTFFYKRIAVRSFIMIYVFSGLAVWFFGRHVLHVGASGVVYGLVAFIFWSGIFRRSLRAIVLGLVVTILYSGMIPGILPNQDGISWESHLLGALVGIFTAYWYKEEIESDEQTPPPFWELEEADEEARPFLPPDTFDKTLEQRRREHEDGNDNPWFSNRT
jgi:membrane associated rhomboid family serine protease